MLERQRITSDYPLSPPLEINENIESMTSIGNSCTFLSTSSGTVEEISGDKSRKMETSNHSLTTPSVSLDPLTVLNSSTNLVKDSAVTTDHTLTASKVLTKLQCFLLWYYYAAIRLNTRLKVSVARINWKNEKGTEEVCDSPSSNPQETQVDSKMVTTTKSFMEGKLSRTHSQITLENNNTTKAIPDSLSEEKGQFEDNDKSDTISGITNASSYPSSIDTTGSSDATIVSVSGDSEAPQCESSKGCVSFFGKYAGILLALFASVCMSIITLVVKSMGNYSPASKVIWRLQGVLLPSMTIMLVVKYKKGRFILNKDSPEGGNCKCIPWKWLLPIALVGRGLFGCSADIFQYYSLTYLPLADSTVISFSTPIAVVIVAHFILKEKCGFVPIITALITLAGVVVISKPPILTGAESMNPKILIGNLLAFGCMICATFTTVIMRFLQHVHFSVTMFALGIVGTLEGIVFTMVTTPFELPSVGSHNDWFLAVAISVLFCVGQLSMTLALQREEAGIVSLVRTCDVLFAFFLQVYFTNEEADMLSYIGAFIVTLGVIITGLRKWVSGLPEHSSIRNRFWFILR